MTWKLHPLKNFIQKTKQIFLFKKEKKNPKQQKQQYQFYRALVASNVFTLTWRDCYFCTEPDNSIIHHGCVCTHFTFVRTEAGVSSSQCAYHSYVSAYEPECARMCENTSNSTWTADIPYHRGREERGKKEKRNRSCHKHGNQSDMKREVRIKEQKEQKQGISTLIFSLSQTRIPQSSWAQSTITKKDTFWITSKTETQLCSTFWHRRALLALYAALTWSILSLVLLVHVFSTRCANYW